MNAPRPIWTPPQNAAPVAWDAILASLRSAQRQPHPHLMQGLQAPAGWRAAVAVVLWGDADGARQIVLVQRGFDAPRHAGELAFPGGMVEAGDRDLPATARRELAEELDWITIEDVDSFVAVWLNLARGRAPGLKLDLATHTLILQLPKENPTLEEMTAFRNLAIGMDASAKKLKHSSFKPAQEENPKFAFRTWLIRLGMNGDDFKATRKVLLANLAGDSSFRSPKPAEASSEEGA